MTLYMYSRVRSIVSCHDPLPYPHMPHSESNTSFEYSYTVPPMYWYLHCSTTDVLDQSFHSLLHRCPEGTLS